MAGSLPDNATSRNRYPMADGLLFYFPNALAAVSEVSRIGNAQHNGSESMHWARNKSTDHANKIMRHLVDAGTMDSDGTRHSAKLAWRALALLQEEIERDEGAPLPRNAWLDKPDDDPELVIDWNACFPTRAQLDAAIPAESAYLASFGPNPDIPEKSPKDDRRIATAEEIEGLRSALTAEQLHAYGIGDVQSRHPMHAEALRDHDERLYGAEDRL